MTVVKGVYTDYGVASEMAVLRQQTLIRMELFTSKRSVVVYPSAD